MYKTGKKKLELGNVRQISTTFEVVLISAVGPASLKSPDCLILLNIMYFGIVKRNRGNNVALYQLYHC